MRFPWFADHYTDAAPQGPGEVVFQQVNSSSTGRLKSRA